MTRVAAENQGLKTAFLDLKNADSNMVLPSICTNTKLVWIESPTNPTLHLIDVARISSLVHSHPSHPLVLINNIFPSP
ncbi:hypothetical protein L208DRAFT_1192065, partial [Tricholoma matsutake]